MASASTITDNIQKHPGRWTDKMAHRPRPGPEAQLDLSLFVQRGQGMARLVDFRVDAAVAHYRERFSAFLDRTAGSAQDLAKQFSQ